MKVKCFYCGEDFEYEPYEGWEEDYIDLEDMRRNHKKRGTYQHILI